MTISAWTDYPMVHLGDVPNSYAPLRPCIVLHYDGNKYATVKLGERVLNFKAGYLYLSAGRCGEVPSIPLSTLKALPPHPGEIPDEISI